MARTELPLNWLAANGVLADPAGGGVVGTADGHFIDTNTRTGVRDQARLEDVVLHVTVATAATDVTIEAGDEPVAVVRAQGPLLAENLPVGVHHIGPFESMRFIKNNGRLHINYETPANVHIWASVHPRGQV
jgi:hypothetical protein